MRQQLLNLGAALGAAIAAAAPGAAGADVTATRTLEESVQVERGGAPLVIVRNVFGDVRVTVHDRDTVDMTAVETITADLQLDIDHARAEVELRTDSEPGRVAFRVRRVGQSGDCDCGRNGWQGYTVRYDIEVRVPRAVAVDLATVNDGDIVVAGVRGAHDAKNVNGNVRLSGLHAPARVSTVNGDIDVTFERAPDAGTSFKTVNGEIDVAFPESLAADFSLQTMNGEIFTDFETATVTPRAASERPRGGAGFRVRMDRLSVLRVGAGGPTHSFNTLNGDILIRKGAR
jgi:hypothetical protein